MTIDNDPQLDLESLLHGLICGAVTESERKEALSRICTDQKANSLLADMLNAQNEARAALGYDQAEPHMRASLSSLKNSLAEPRHSRRTPRAAWYWRAAAAVVIGVSLYVAISAHRSSQFMREELADIRKAVTAPVIAVSAAELAQYRLVWDQVSDGANTWVLLKNGYGEFGSINSHSPADLTGEKVVLLQYRIVDQDGQSVYAADLLVPDRPGIDVQVPDAGDISGLGVSLTLATADERATVGLSVAGPATASTGVAGQTLIGGGSDQIGSFKVSDEQLNVFVRTQRLSRFRI